MNEGFDGEAGNVGANAKPCMQFAWPNVKRPDGCMFHNS